jgi:hypothetical protein
VPPAQGLPAAVGLLVGTPSSQTSSVHGFWSWTGTHAVPPVPLLLVMFRENPGLAPHFLALLFHMEVPDHASVAVVEAALDQLIPVELRADLVLELRDANPEISQGGGETGRPEGKKSRDKFKNSRSDLPASPPPCEFLSPSPSPSLGGENRSHPQISSPLS